MNRWGAFLFFAFVAGCGSSRTSVDAGNEQDAGVRDGGNDAAVDGGRDAGLGFDASVPLCDPGDVLVDPCEPRDVSSVKACGDDALVFFDGSHCRAANPAGSSDQCAAFASLEHCAISCAEAGYCDHDKLRNVDDPDRNHSCTRVWGRPSAPSREFPLCGFAPRWECDEPLNCVLYEPDRTPEDEFQKMFCALSLYPLSMRIDCLLEHG